MKSKRVFDVIESELEIKKLLQQNGFVLTHSSSGNEHCVITTEIWTLEEYNSFV